MWNLVSLDGFFQGEKDWQLDWHLLVVDNEFRRIAADQLRSADRLLFGRVTYEGMAAYWSTAQDEIADLMNGIEKIVFSRTMTSAGWNNTRLVKEDAVAEVKKLKAGGGKESLVFGSAQLSETFIANGLFDEYRVLLTPVILGTGSPLFGRGLSRRDLKLLETRPLASGGVILRYEPIP